MKNFPLILLVFFYACSSTPPAASCEQFHSGNFTMHDDKKTYNVTREDSLQVEIVPGRTDTSFSKIKWISPCEYEITYIPHRANYNQPGSSAFFMYKFKAKIIKVEKNYCIFEFSKEGFDEKIVDTLVKVN